MNVIYKVKNMIQELQEPWIVFRPLQAVRRLREQYRKSLFEEEIHKTTWGLGIWCNPKKAIGENIRYRGLFDIVVSEALVRLLQRGSTLVDAGSNIGYMSMLAASVVGPHGRVLSFEPNQELIPILDRNAKISAKKDGCATINVIDKALGREAGRAMLFASKNYLMNDGVAHIIRRDDQDSLLGEVTVTTLDQEMDGQNIDVLKMDVEGFEVEVLKGAQNLLATRRITHILFEDHDIDMSVIPKYLSGFGYNVFRLGYTLLGPVVMCLEAELPGKVDGSPSYLASLQTPEEIFLKLRPRGWRVLRSLSESK